MRELAIGDLVCMAGDVTAAVLAVVIFAVLDWARPLPGPLVG